MIGQKTYFPATGIEPSTGHKSLTSYELKIIPKKLVFACFTAFSLFRDRISISQVNLSCLVHFSNTYGVSMTHALSQQTSHVQIQTIFPGGSTSRPAWVQLPNRLQRGSDKFYRCKNIFLLENQVGFRHHVPLSPHASALPYKYMYT